MARNDPTIYMRIPQTLKDALDAAALENKRSLTAEVVARLEQTFKTRSEHTSPAAGTSYAKPHVIDALSEGMRLQLAIAALESQARIAKSKVNKVQDAISQIEANLAKAEAEEDSKKARMLKSRLSDEISWLREIEIEYISTIEELAELKRELAAAQATSDERFKLGA